MTHSKAIDKFDTRDRARAAPAPGSFVRITGQANLIVATMTIVEICVIARIDHDPKAFGFGLWAVPIATLITWATAAVLSSLERAPRALRALGRRLVGRPGFLRSEGSGVRDDWLDHPEPNDR
jgi:hypothetical protein